MMPMTTRPPSYAVSIETDPLPGGGMTRRRFVQAALASAAAGLAVPAWMREAAGASGLAASDGILVVVTLRGGCDPLSVLIPSQGERRAQYEAARRGISVPASSLIQLTNEFGLHPTLPRLAERFGMGDVALLPGVGLARPTRSHFHATDRMQSANEAEPATGWLGRYIDDVDGSGSAVDGVSLSTLVPLHMKGHRRGTIAVPVGASLWGANTSGSSERACHDAVRAFGAEPTGLGAWGDLAAGAAASAVDNAAVIGQLTKASPIRNGSLSRLLDTTALALNARIGIRAIAVEVGGYDTHAGQPDRIAKLLGQLDEAVELFFSTLEVSLRPQVAVLIESEFGRTVNANSSNGTDHGNAGMSMLVGDNVNGGVHGAYPSLVDLDRNGNLIPNVDHREVYATILERWLAGDANAVLGATFGQHDLFAASPGS